MQGKDTFAAGRILPVRASRMSRRMTDPQPKFPPSGRLLAIDFGTVRWGLAVCDADRRIASPLATYTRRNERLDSEYLRKLLVDEQIVGIVVGLPIHNRGTESQKSRETRAFADWLKRTYQLPIVFFDERYSTARARELLGAELTPRQRKAKLDKLAAQVILTSFLESDPQHDWRRSLEDLTDDSCG